MLIIVTIVFALISLYLTNALRHKIKVIKRLKSNNEWLYQELMKIEQAYVVPDIDNKRENEAGLP